MKKKILNNIANELYISIESNSNEYGLLNGRFGELLFLFEYLETDNKGSYIINKIEALLNEILKNHNNYFHSYCSGFAGVGIGLEILQKKEKIELDNEFYDLIDQYLLNCLDQLNNSFNWDFLHGGLGIGFYFLKRYAINPITSYKAIQSLIILFQKQAVNDKENLKWSRIAPFDQSEEFNASFSHGISSIIMFMARTLEVIPEKEKEITPLLTGAINYILSLKSDPNEFDCFFPDHFTRNHFISIKSRLAWCYGDLTMAYSIWYAGKVLNNSFYMDTGMEILLYSCSRRELKENRVFDACICHGSAGVSVIFNALYQKTAMPEFKEAFFYWQQKTEEMACHADGLAGYKMLNTHTNKHFNSTNVLEGIAGIGFSLLNNQDSCINELLLLDFK